MSHQITGLIRRTSALWPLERCLGLLFQQVLGNVETEQSPPQVTTTYRPVQPPAARRDTHMASPAPTTTFLTARCFRLCLARAMPKLGRCLSLCLLEEISSQRTVPERHICLGSFLPYLHHAPRTCLSQDPQLQATAGRADGQKAPHGGPTSPWSHNVLLLGGQHLMQLISTTTMLLLPASRLPAASAPGDAGF